MIMNRGTVRIAPESLLSGVTQSETTLGEGAFGVVFLGCWRGWKVAIKRFHPHKMGLEEKTGKPSQDFQRFIAEHDTLRALSHPSIVQVFGWIRPNAERASHGLVIRAVTRGAAGAARAAPLFRPFFFFFFFFVFIEITENNY